MKKLRLLLWEDCNRNCPGCCNKDWDLKNLPIETDYCQYDLIMLTGGEPMLYPVKLNNIIQTLKRWTLHQVPIVMYTAKIDDIYSSLLVLNELDGITITLHEQKDVPSFDIFNTLVTNLLWGWYKNKSLRLNVFKGINLKNINLSKWKVKKNIEWIKNCPLPEDEVFKRFM